MWEGCVFKSRRGHYVTTRPQSKQIGHSFQLGTVVANILNKHLWTADKERSFSLGLADD
jgi:hypothetical protein